MKPPEYGFKGEQLISPAARVCPKSTYDPPVQPNNLRARNATIHGRQCAMPDTRWGGVLSAHSEHVVLDPAMKSGSWPKASCSRESRQLRVSLSLTYGLCGRVGEEEGCVPVLDAGWTYVLISRVEVHGRVMVGDALGLLFLTTLATVNASACLCHMGRCESCL